MVVFQWVVGILLMVIAVFLVVIVLMQSDKDQRLSGTITGGSSDTYYGQNKGRSRDRILSRMTLITSIVFTGLVIAMYVMISRYGIGA